MTPLSDVNSMRNAKIQIRGLNAVGVVSDTYGTLLGSILMPVIPEDVASSFSRMRDEDEILDVNQLVKILKERSGESRTDRKSDQN